MTQPESSEARNTATLRNVVGLADATERRLCLDMLAEVALGETGGVQPFRLDHAGVERVHADFFRAEFLGERLVKASTAALVAL